MASGERRLGLGSGRRGMTVLGKIPTPSVPKPINLPSQRLENKGLEADVELVPRGTFSWGSSGRSHGGVVGNSGTPGATSIPQKGAGALNGAMKPQALPASGNDGESSFGSSRPSSAGSNTRPSSAPTTATNRAWGSMLKTPVEAKVQSIGFVVSSVEPSHLGSKDNADGLLQENKALSYRPTSADGVVSDKDKYSQSGIGSYGRAGLGVGPGSGPVPEGFHHPGHGYNLPCMWQGMTPANGQPGPYSGPFPPEVYYRPFGAPPPPAPHHLSNMKERDMVMMRMANRPGLHGSYPPPLRPGEFFGRPGVYPPRFEQLVMSGNGNLGSCHAGMGIFFPDSSYPSSQREGNNIQNFSSGPTYGNERNHRMPKYPGRHKSASAEGFEHGKEPSEGLPVSPERKITLLTKAPQLEVSSATLNGSIALQISNEGSDASGQALSSNNKMVEPSERKNTDGSEEKRSSRGHGPAQIMSGGSVVSPSHAKKVESKTGYSSLSSRQELPMSDNKSKVDVNHVPKLDADSQGVKCKNQAFEGALTSGSTESVEESFIAEPTKHLAAADDIPVRGDHKAKTKAQNLRNEKEWRPKSPVVEAKLANERESCDVSSTFAGNSDDLQTPTLPPSQKGGKRRPHRAMAIGNFPPLDSSDCSPNSKAGDLPEPLNNAGPSSAEPATSVTSTINTDNGKKFSKEASSYGLPSGGVQVVTIDNSKGSAAEVLPLRGDHKAKSRPSNLKAEKEWRPKSPAVDISAASDSVTGSQTTESNVASASDVSSSHDMKIAEQGGILPLETYDYEGQRAKMKEIAAQRATQRRKEEEERVKEQKAKALAKLEELNRRTSVMELIESGSVVPVNEAPNKKPKRKPDSSRCSAMDASWPDPGILEKQLLDGVMALPRGTVNKKASEVGEDAGQWLSDANQTARNMREESRKDSLRVSEKQRVYRKVATSVYDHHQGQEQLPTDEVGMQEEPLPLVHDIDYYDSSSTQKYGKVNEGMKHGRRNGTRDYINKASSTIEDEGSSVPSPTEEHQVLVASQAGNTCSRRGGSSKGGPSTLLHQTSSEGQTKAREGSLPEESFSNTGQQAHGQKHSQRRKTSLVIEDVEIEGKQSIDCISASEVGFGAEKPGRTYVSWRQKSSIENHVSVSEESAACDTRESQNTWNKSPTQTRNPRKVRNDGRHANGAPAVKHRQVETRDQSEEHETETNTELQRPNALCELIPEAVSKKNEGVRAGPSRNGWRPKTNRSIANESRSRAVEYVPEGMLDSSQPSNPLIVKDNAQYPSAKGSRAPSGYKNGPTKVPSAHGQVGNEVMTEEDRIGHVRNRHRHKGENVAVSQRRKQESQSHSEPTISLDGNTENLKQLVHTTKTMEPPFDQQGTRSSSKSVGRNENCKQPGQLHSTSRREQLHEPRGQHPRRGHDRHLRHGQFNGCISSVELDTRGPGTASKTEVTF